MKLEFFGASRSVTGSCHMLSVNGLKLLLDCGMRQGVDSKGIYGEGDFPFDPASIDAVVLTHAHIDHSGLLPLLTKRGFKGVVLCTEATALLATIMLPDSAHIQAQEADWQSRKNLRAGKAPVEPLYDMEDVQACLRLFRGVFYDEIIKLFPNVRVRLKDIGHLLGSAAIELWADEGGKTTKLVYSGDVGRNDRPIIQDPEEVKDADYLILEGTYGDRVHPLKTEADKESELKEAIRAALMRGGNLVIPSFAVGRTQELLYFIKRLLKSGALPELNNIPVYIDSPLGIEATKIYERAKAYHDEEALEMSKDGSPFDFPNLRVALTSDESKAINDISGSKIIISSSGMCEAGRIRHHLKHNLYRADSTVLFTGYQALGTLGRTLVDGAKKVKLFGEQVRVNAQIVVLEGLSGHADKEELIAWVKGIYPPPQKIFLVHGEENALLLLEASLNSLGYNTAVPYVGDSYTITAEKPLAHEQIKRATELKTKERSFRIMEQLALIETILKRAQERRSPDMDLKYTLLEADIKSLAEKWDELI